MMATIQNAFANSSSSLMMAKLNENIVDTLMPPLSANELTTGLAMGAATRGLLVALVVGAGISLFVPVEVHCWGYILFHAAAASLMLALIGVITAIWADKFDHIATVTTFVVLPLTFLSGTFLAYPVIPHTHYM